MRNLIEVAGPSISDKELKAKLAEKLAYDRVGYGNTFNAITISVENGVVTLGGHARTYVDRDSALALVCHHPASRTWRTRSRSIPFPSWTTRYGWKWPAPSTAIRR